MLKQTQTLLFLFVNDQGGSLVGKSKVISILQLSGFLYLPILYCSHILLLSVEHVHLNPSI